MASIRYWPRPRPPAAVRVNPSGQFDLDSTCGKTRRQLSCCARAPNDHNWDDKSARTDGVQKEPSPKLRGPTARTFSRVAVGPAPVACQSRVGHGRLSMSHLLACRMQAHAAARSRAVTRCSRAHASKVRSP